MRPSWIPIFAALIGIGCGAFALFPMRWSPDLSHGILAGMAMYFVGFTRRPSLARSKVAVEGVRLLGSGGLLPGVLYRVLGFLLILVALAYVYFDRRLFFDITWPLLILAAWGLADSILNSRGEAKP
ncbi:MAG: hypothetical protein E6K76_05365 [Candidatus Eisenbacteria bacterium]|uniref:Uncharacterized protein n=1 Tax=Eiseniibacteriota bacterium TaxID=2212470 RepID=A0A538T6L2_UNCEI|nr:MAG: hypothetical protein E6K76_05365 [Candidatus Eisenbacteria bacterium]